MSQKVKPPMRWGLNHAAIEFGVDELSLNRWLRAAEQPPDENGCWSTRQILRAVAGDMDAEKLREVRHRANLLELEELEQRRKLIPADMVAAAWESIIVGIRQGILASDLSEQKKRDLLDELRSIPADEYFKAPKQSEDDGDG